MCMILDYDDTRPIFFRERISVAKKNYQCTECHRLIPVGAQYQYVAGKWQDDDYPEGQAKKMRTYRTCMECFADWQHLIEVVSEHEGGQAVQLLGGVLREAIEDAFFECGALAVSDLLIQKWCPESFKQYLDEYSQDVEYFEVLGISPAEYLKTHDLQEHLADLEAYRQYQKRFWYWSHQGISFGAYLREKEYWGDLFEEREKAIPIAHREHPFQGHLVFK